MHAARLVAVQSALSALLSEQRADLSSQVDGVYASFIYSPEGSSLDLTYLANGMPVGGEGV